MRVKSRVNSNLNLFPISEIFDDATENAVKVFQSQYGLEQNGIVDRTVWTALTELYNDALDNLPVEYSGNYAKLYPGYFLTPGTSGDDVRDLQTYLSAIARNTGRIPNVEIDGYYGDATRDAVYTFQRINGLPITGSVGPNTWRRIALVYDSIINSADSV